MRRFRVAELLMKARPRNAMFQGVLEARFELIFKLNYYNVGLIYL